MSSLSNLSSLSPSSLTEIDSKIRNFVDAGNASLSQHSFSSEDLGKRRGALGAARSGVMSRSLDEGGDSEKPVQYRMNQTGNIFYATTSPELQAETKKLFDGVTVLFSAMTRALAGKKKTLFDYESWGDVIRKSGFFVEVQKFMKILTIKSGSVEINTQVVQQLLPGLKTGSSMDIAKDILSALNGTYTAETTTEETKLGHLLFICEELFGAPSVTVRLFYATKKSHTTLTSSPCHKSATQSFEQKQEADTFLFVSPEAISAFADKFGNVPQEYKNLVETLSGYIE